LLPAGLKVIKKKLVRKAIDMIKKLADAEVKAAKKGEEEKEEGESRRQGERQGPGSGGGSGRAPPVLDSCLLQHPPRQPPAPHCCC
jgi:hypothetical protein